ncbi:MAG: hypothetical protein Q4C36_02560 [Coriobacteriia bacterium]|nr:hypothetical protein [Coriobacteriia bacterium]
MGKIRTAYSESVCNSDEFLGLSLEAQALYFHLGFDADTIGEIHGAKSKARGYGMGLAALDELMEAGYLLEIGGRWFIAHYYENNVKPTNDNVRKAANRLWDARPAPLAFAGESWGSAYVAMPTDYVDHEGSLQVAYEEPTCSLQVDSNGNGNGSGDSTTKVICNDKGNTMEGNVSAMEGVGVNGEGGTAHTVPCPACQQVHEVQGEEGAEWVHCDRLGMTYWWDSERNQWAR